MAALGPAVYRAVKKGRIASFGEVETLVGFIERRVEEKHGLGLDLAAARRWAEWVVREGVRRIEEERAERESSERFLRKLILEMEEARRAWTELNRGTLAFPGGLKQNRRGDEPKPRGKGEALGHPSELGAGLSAEVPGCGACGAHGHVEPGGAGGLSSDKRREAERTGPTKKA